MNRLCQAYSVMTRTGTRKSGWAPTKTSATKSSSPPVVSSAAVRSASNCSGSIGWLIAPHATVSSVVASRTMYLSFGERPV